MWRTKQSLFVRSIELQETNPRIQRAFITTRVLLCCNQRQEQESMLFFVCWMKVTIVDWCGNEVDLLSKQYECAGAMAGLPSILQRYLEFPPSNKERLRSILVGEAGAIS